MSGGLFYYISAAPGKKADVRRSAGAFILHGTEKQS